MRRVLPGSLFGRSMLIVLIPLVFTQALVLGLFYGTYLNVVSRRLTDGVAGEISLVISMLQHADSEAARQDVLEDASSRTQLGFAFRPAARLRKVGTNHVLGPMDEDYERALTGLGLPFSVDWRVGSETVRTSVALPDRVVSGGGVLEILAPKKRLTIGPIWFFVAWVLSSSLVLLVIAGLFMRSQVRAVRRLARAAEAFGLGREAGSIPPRGAREIRRAAIAFNRMQERVNRFVAQRTAVLAGVSHDLRTPLTRLRLALAMLPVEGMIDARELRPDLGDMVADIEEMERLIGSYLSFARGEGAEKAVATDLRALVEEVASAARRAGGAVLGVRGAESLEIVIRPDAIRRVLMNLADNARRHGGAQGGGAVLFTLVEHRRRVEIRVEDDGPGLSRARREQLLRSGDVAQGSAGPGGAASGGVSDGGGLGLTIVRDIVHAHGGSVRFADSPLGGFAVVIDLPR